MTDITPLVEIVVMLALFLISRYLIPFIKSKTTTAQYQELEVWITAAVEAAEQLFVGNKRGKERKEYVINWLAERNISYDADKIDLMIESAVYKLKNKK